MLRLDSNHLKQRVSTVRRRSVSEVRKGGLEMVSHPKDTSDSGPASSFSYCKQIDNFMSRSGVPENTTRHSKEM